MSNFRVLVSCPLIQDTIGDYDAEFEAAGVTYDVPEVDQHLTEAELLDVIDRYHGVIAGDDQFTERVIDGADNLQVIAKWGVGTDNIDKAAAERAGVTVVNTPGAFDAEVADVVIGYAVMLTRDLHLIDHAVRGGDWHCPRGESLPDLTMGIIGVGDIGSAVARRAADHGMTVLGNDVRDLPRELVEDYGVEPVAKDELLDRAEIVSLNCALTPETHELIGAAELDAIGADGYLINVARGELVDEPALVDALRADRLAGAALDVFQEEPLPTDSPLTDMDAVILGTHNAQNTHQAVQRTNDRAVSNLLDGLE